MVDWLLASDNYYLLLKIGFGYAVLAIHKDLPVVKGQYAEGMDCGNPACFDPLYPLLAYQ